MSATRVGPKRTPPPPPSPFVADHPAVLPDELAEMFAVTPSDLDERDKSLSLQQAFSELQMFLRAITGSDAANPQYNNIRYVSEPFTADTPQPVRADRGDFEMSFKLPGFFGSSFESILRSVKNAHRIYVHVAGLRITIRVHRLPYWTQACNIVAAIATEAEKRSRRFLPYEALAQAARDSEELNAALCQLEPDFLFTPVDVQATAPKDGMPLGLFLLQKFFPEATASMHQNMIAFWAITATADAAHSDSSSAQIKVWVVQSALFINKQQQEEAPLAAAAVKVEQVVVKIKKEKQEEEELPPPVPAAALASLLNTNKKRRAGEVDMLHMNM